MHYSNNLKSSLNYGHSHKNTHLNKGFGHYNYDYGYHHNYHHSYHHHYHDSFPYGLYLAGALSNNYYYYPYFRPFRYGYFGHF